MRLQNISGGDGDGVGSVIQNVTERFSWALDTHNILNHIEGETMAPVDPVPEASRKANKLSDTKTELDKDWKK